MIQAAMTYANAKILALETSSQAASLAVVEAGCVIGERSLPLPSRLASALCPAMGELLESVGWTPANLDAVALSIGPGAFTSLRIGVTTAKTLAYAVKAQVVSVDSLLVCAWQAASQLAGLAAGQATHIVAASDALRGQLFSACFSPWHEDVLGSAEIELVEVDRWLANLPANAIVTGPAVNKLAGRLPSHVTVAEAASRIPLAASVGQIAHRKLMQGEVADLWKLAPLYIRPSYADEKR